MTYKGRFTRVGNSKSYAFESALFRSHPEFDSHNVEAEIIGPGVLLVRFDSQAHKPEEVISRTVAHLLQTGVLILGVTRGQRLEERVLQIL